MRPNAESQASEPQLQPQQFPRPWRGRQNKKAPGIEPACRCEAIEDDAAFNLDGADCVEASPFGSLAPE